MSDTKHTPGPWKVDATRTLEGVRDDGKVQLIAAIFGVVEHGDMRDKTRAEANARLIAAAPELLESCRQLSNMLRAAYMELGIQASGNRWNAAQAAIAKALGS